MVLKIPSAPEPNAELFRLLYALETALRELIICELQKVAGPLWYKHRLPGDVLKKYKEAVLFERNARWCDLVPHHPLYYVDFSDLRKVIQQGNNWQDAFKGIFVDPVVLAGVLVELEFIRNKIAHNRLASSHELSVGHAAYGTISAAVGNDRFLVLVANPTRNPELRMQLEALRAEAATVFAKMNRSDALPELSSWQRVSSSWWLDESYLGRSVASIRAFFGILEEYSHLPRERGSGYLIERWVERHAVSESYAAAEAELKAIMEDFPS